MVDSQLEYRMADKDKDKETEYTPATPEYGRALLTDSNRKILTGEKDVNANHEYKIQSTLRQRIKNSLPRDIDILQQQAPELFDIVYEVVTQYDRYDLGTDVTGRQVTVGATVMDDSQTAPDEIGLARKDAEDQQVIGDSYADPGRYVLVRVQSSEAGSRVSDTVTETPHEVLESVEISGEDPDSVRVGFANIDNVSKKVMVTNPESAPGTYFLVREDR